MKQPFSYSDGRLFCDQVVLDEIAAACGTPCYVYSARGILNRYQAYDEAFGRTPHLVCYAVKANSNLSLLRLLAHAGAGFDIVSGGELFRVLQAGGTPSKIVFSGVGKTSDEIEYALNCRIHSFNCESEPELALINELALKRGLRARVALRVNPDVDAATHPYISTGLRDNKFGVDIADAERVYEYAQSLPGLAPESVSCHIGSQLLDPAPLMEAVDRMVALAGRLQQRGLPIRNLDLGGGLGIAYQPGQTTPVIPAFIDQMKQRVAELGLTIMIEPGRSLVGECGVLLSRVIHRKKNSVKEFVVLDAAMNDLLRPALYQAHHEILPVTQSNRPLMTADIVGPVCETGDFLAKGRTLPELESGELVAVMSAGAYGFVMSSNYNSRPRAAEVLVEDNRWRIVRQREKFEDLVRGE